MNENEGVMLQGTEGPARVMVVDDENELIAALTEMLNDYGYEAVGFSDAEEALAALRSENFDVLLVDLMMPRMDGITFLKGALEIDPRLVGLLMTGQGTVQTAVEAMKSGAYDYLLKPFKRNLVLTALERALEVRRLREDNIKLRELVSIHELGQKVALTLEAEEIFRQTALAALAQWQADEVSFLVPNPHGNGLVLAAAYGNNHSRLIGQTVPTQGTIAGWVVDRRETLVLQGEIKDERFIPVHPRPEIQEAVSMPMVAGKKLVGVFNLNRTHRRRPLTQGEVRGLAILVTIAASALQNARLYKQTENRLNRLSALRTIDLAISSSLDLRVTLGVLLDQVTDQLRVDGSLVLLLDPHTHSLRPTAGRGLRTDPEQLAPVFLGTGIAGMAAVERRTISLPELFPSRTEPNLENYVSVEGFRSCFATPLIAKGHVEGVLEVFHRDSFSPDLEWIEFFEALAGQAAIAIESARLFEGLQRSNSQLTLAYNATIEGWSRALDLRDQETEGHSQRVTEMTLRLARSLNRFSDEELAHIRRGALLHDIGKMGIPDRILQKPGPLSEPEWQIMRKHPEYAYQLLSPIAFLRKSLDIPYCHHEKWDGSGYPRGLKGEEIPLAARIFAVVDVWDALRSNRAYRIGWPEPKVIEHLLTASGTHFDPEIVRAFIQLAGHPQ